MKNFKTYFLISILLVTLIYVTNITGIPQKIVAFEGEKIDLGTIFGIFETKQEIITASSNSDNSNIISEEKITLSLFNIIDVKNVNITTIEQTKIIPAGNIIGLKLYSSGVLVIGMTEIEGQKPYENSGIETGDLIIGVNENAISTTDELVKCVNNSNGKIINITYMRDGQTYKTNIEPTATANKEYKLGLWVRDGATGIGTITYYNPSTGQFGALGHGIVDSDTGKLISIEKGEIVSANILDIEKGKEGSPGQIKGTISSGENIGEIYLNTEFGIYGNITNKNKLNINLENAIEVAKREEIQLGGAKIILVLEDGIRKEYNIEIKKIYKNNNSDNRSMVIKITDEELLNLTGGIIQGMSGAPIIQNGKFIGAVTHVFVNEPTEGYAIFGDLMIKQMANIE